MISNVLVQNTHNVQAFVEMLKIGLVTVSLVPQFMLNYLRKSTIGFSSTTIWLYFFGSIFSMFSLITEVILRDVKIAMLPEHTLRKLRKEDISKLSLEISCDRKDQ